MDATVDRLDLSFFDYRLRNAALSALHSIATRCVWRRCGLSGRKRSSTSAASSTCTTSASRCARRGTRVSACFRVSIRTSAVPAARASLEAAFEGPMRDPIVTGTMTVENGQVRHFGLPHALENISGPVRFDTRSIRLDEVTARIGGGLVQFGGRIDMEAYRPTRVDVTMIGDSMRLRFPEGMRSLVDADLSVQGMVDALTLSGTVTVRNAYIRAVSTIREVCSISRGAVVGLWHRPGRLVRPRWRPRDCRYVRRADRRSIYSRDPEQHGPHLRHRRSAAAEAPTTDRCSSAAPKSTAVNSHSRDDGARSRVARSISTTPHVSSRSSTSKPRRASACPGRPIGWLRAPRGMLDRLTPAFEADPPLPEVEALSLLFGDVAPGQDVEFRQYAPTSRRSSNCCASRRRAR